MPVRKPFLVTPLPHDPPLSFSLSHTPFCSAYLSCQSGAVQEGAAPWGLNVLRYEITEVTPDVKIREAMDKQAAAERNRREKVSVEG